VNRVYDVSYPKDNVYYAVGGENRSKALVNYMYEIGENASEFIHYRARLARGYDGKPIFTEKNGFIDMEELIPKGYKTWWNCPECGDEGDKEAAFEYVAIDQYRCKGCGYIGSIPFVE
jgi:predicted RNA-binding Zn-ribbon protein involved in translation (DUF1610 family)